MANVCPLVRVPTLGTDLRFVLRRMAEEHVVMSIYMRKTDPEHPYWIYSEGRPDNPAPLDELARSSRERAPIARSDVPEVRAHLEQWYSAEGEGRSPLPAEGELSRVKIFRVVVS